MLVRLSENEKSRPPTSSHREGSHPLRMRNDPSTGSINGTLRRVAERLYLSLINGCFSHARLPFHRFQAQMADCQTGTTYKNESLRDTIFRLA